MSLFTTTYLWSQFSEGRIVMQQAFVLMANYNRQLNRQCYACAAQLSQHDVKQERGAYFGSIFATLNHILVGDILWLQRFARHPSAFRALQPVLSLPVPTGLQQILYSNLGELQKARELMDELIIDFIGQIRQSNLQHHLLYHNSKGLPYKKNFASLLLHFFNHQTHHRGQISTLLSQFGIDVGVTDLLSLIVNED
ncbi:DinB family protein [Agarivorans sp. QJM3NY_33]|uniref:DinB family protein n=1 Tax=Agarivorans sp. QJM3NY_33 TaxID=3421432 RepID=UPI003D7ED265